MFAKTRCFLTGGAILCALAAMAQDEFDFLEDEAGETASEEVSEETGEAEESADAEETPSGDAADAAAAPVKKTSKPFHSLVRCTKAKGNVQIMRPGTQDWQTVEEERYYPMGAIYKAVRTSSVPEGTPSAEFELGKDATISINDSGEFALRDAAIGEQKRTIVLRGGTLTLSMPRTMPDESIFVAAPHFEAKNISGEAVFAYKTTADGDEAIVRVVTGHLALKGAHYSIAEMSAADRLRIRTTGDDLETLLRCEIGKYKVTIDQGVERRKNFETGADDEVPVSLEYPATPKCTVKIFRHKSAVADRMIVSTLTFNAKGSIQNRRVFAEGLYNVNSGELVLKPVKISADGTSEKASEETSELDLSGEELDGGDADGGEGGDDLGGDGGDEDLF